MICENEINASSSLGDGKAIRVGFSNSSCGDPSHFLPLVAALVNYLLPAAQPLTVTPVLMDRLPRPTDQTTHRRQITSLTVATLA